MKVYIVRHGQVDSNIKKIYNILDEDINETGIKETEQLKQKIQNLEYDVLYCSPLLRARHTANIINFRNKEILIDNRLEERSPGNLSGKPYEFTNREAYWDYYSDVKYGTEESMQSLFDRINSFLDELKMKQYENVLIVAHSGVSKAFYAYFNGIPEDGKFLNLGLKNGEMEEYNF